MPLAFFLFVQDCRMRTLSVVERRCTDERVGNKVPFRRGCFLRAVDFFAAAHAVRKKSGGDDRLKVAKKKKMVGKDFLFLVNLARNLLCLVSEDSVRFSYGQLV